MRYQLAVDGTLSSPDNVADVVTEMYGVLSKDMNCGKFLERGTNAFRMRISRSQESQATDFSDLLPSLFDSFGKNKYMTRRCVYGLLADGVSDDMRHIVFPSKVAEISMTLPEDTVVPHGRLLRHLYQVVHAPVSIEQEDRLVVLGMQTTWVREQLEESLGTVLRDMLFDPEDVEWTERPFEGSLVDIPVSKPKK